MNYLIKNLRDEYKYSDTKCRIMCHEAANELEHIMNIINLIKIEVRNMNDAFNTLKQCYNTLRELYEQPRN